jgi:hypothetical protein
MQLVRLERRPERWNQLIANFPQKTIFHEEAWLDFLEATHRNSCIDYFEIHSPEGMGYFCARRARKFLIHFWGGPHNCIYVCPLVPPGVDQFALMDSLVAACKREHIEHLVLCGPWLDPQVMEMCGFVLEHQVSHVCPLSNGKETVWQSMDGTCRTRIRKAEKSGLVVEPTTDPIFVDEFYSRFTALLAHKGQVPSYGIDYMRQLFSHLGGADRLFALRVMHRKKVVGAAYYYHDDGGMYLGDVAYEVDSLPLCPTHLLHWTAMQIAIDREIPIFWMGGHPQPSRFTRKFGGDLQTVTRYHMSFVPLLHQARKAYSLCQEGKAQARVLWSSLVRPWHGGY